MNKEQEKRILEHMKDGKRKSEGIRKYWKERKEQEKEKEKEKEREKNDNNREWRKQNIWIW